MSFEDEGTEPTRPGDDAHRVLSPIELEDLKIAHDRILGAVPEAILAFCTGDGESMMECLGAMMSGLTVIRCNLGLDDVDVDDDEPNDPVAPVDRITRNGGRTNG